MNRKWFWLQECQGTAGIQHREHRECSFRGEGPVTLLLLLIYSLDIDVETSLYLLHRWTVFHCHHDFMYHLPVLMSWSHSTYWNWMEPSRPQRDRTETMIWSHSEEPGPCDIKHLITCFPMLRDLKWTTFRLNQNTKFMSNYAIGKRMKDKLQDNINLNSLKSITSVFLSKITEWKRNPTVLCQNTFFPNSSNMNSILSRDLIENWRQPHCQATQCT